MFVIIAGIAFDLPISFVFRCSHTSIVKRLYPNNFMYATFPRIMVIGRCQNHNLISKILFQVISSTISRYRKLKATHLKEQKKSATPNISDCLDISLLLEAWKPISMGHKGR